MFETLKGNIKTKKILRKIIAEDRVPQALLFTGRSGIGKKNFALEVARSFVCVSRKENLPCGDCAACRRSEVFVLPTSGKPEHYKNVFFSQHPDIGIVVPNKNVIYVDAIRRLVEEANYHPYEGRARVFVIDEAEKLSLSQKSAANALLKTLEEPAATTHIILVTSKPSTILKTIHSRCQTIRFSPVPEQEIEQFVLESTETSTGDARLLAKAAKGSISAAISLDLDEYRTMRSHLLEVIAAAAGRTRISRALRVSEELAGQKEPDAFEKSLELLESLVRDILLISRGLSDEITHVDIGSELNGLSDEITATSLTKWIEEIEALKASLRFNVNKKVGADALFVKMAGS